MERYFVEYDAPNVNLINLLGSTVLGTNGACYRHLDTSDRIQKLDNPLFLCLEKNDHLLGSIAFCRRNGYWYIRYFSFHTSYQSSGKKKSRASTKGALKAYLNSYFLTKLSDSKVKGFYAYIDPRNQRSKDMAALFNLKTSRKLIAQSFSRIHPQKHSNYSTCSYEHVADIIQNTFAEYAHFFSEQLLDTSFSIVKDQDGSILAMAAVRRVHWEIVRLPGRLGGLFTKIIPYVPLLNKLIVPSNHRFVAIDSVYIASDHVKNFSTLCESILSDHQVHSLLWWVDKNDCIYAKLKNKLQWGLLDKLVGRNEVDLVTSGDAQLEKKVHYTCGFDFI